MWAQAGREGQCIFSCVRVPWLWAASRGTICPYKGEDIFSKDRIGEEERQGRLLHEDRWAAAELRRA